MIVRTALQEDISRIVDLLTAVFPRHPRSEASWRWSNLEQPGISVVAEEDGRIIGHYSFRFQQFTRRGESIMGAFGQQAAIHPQCRDLRTVVEIVTEAERLAAERCTFAFAFPNEHMAPIKERLLEWNRVRAIPNWELNAAEYRLSIEQRLRDAPAQIHAIRRMATFPKIDSGLFTAARPDTLSQATSPDWLEWRYSRNPLHHYAAFGAFDDRECVGVVVLKTHHDDAAHLGHILSLNARAEDDSTKLRLLAASVDYFDFMGAERIVIWNERAENRDIFAELGFASSISGANLYAKPLTESARDLVECDWSFDMGISDVF